MKPDLLRMLPLFCLCLLTLALLSEAALASTADDIFGTISPINKLVAFMTGPFAFLVVIVGIVIMGGMLIFGNDISGFGRRILLLVLGGGLVLGSVQVVSTLFNGGAGAIYTPGDIPDDMPLVITLPIDERRTKPGAGQ